MALCACVTYATVRDKIFELFVFIAYVLKLKKKHFAVGMKKEILANTNYLTPINLFSDVLKNLI